jgi:hypothetical protein
MLVEMKLTLVVSVPQTDPAEAVDVVREAGDAATFEGALRSAGIPVVAVSVTDIKARE